MKQVACMRNCTFGSLTDVIKGHYGIVLVAGVAGALFGLTFGGISWALIGTGVGALLAIVYGFIPRVFDCVDECPLQS